VHTLRIYFFSDYKGQEKDVLLPRLLYACRGLKNSQKKKALLHNNITKISLLSAGEGGLEGNQILKCISTLSGQTLERVLTHLKESRDQRLLLWAYIQVLGMLLEQNRGDTGVGKGHTAIVSIVSL
jgi:hypothetical protein